MSALVDVQADEPVRDLLHLVASPAGPLVTGAVRALLEARDRRGFYKSLLVEGNDSDPCVRELVLAARWRGVPVMIPRAPRGAPLGARIRAALDEAFYARSAQPVLLHVHAAVSLPRTAPARWLRLLVPGVPLLESVYEPGAAGGARVVTRGRGLSAPTVLPLASFADPEVVSRLHEAALASPGLGAARGPRRAGPTNA